MKKTLITLFALTALFISTGLTMAEDEAAPEKGAAPEEVVETKADKAETDKAEDAVEEKGGDAKKADDDAGEEAATSSEAMADDMDEAKADMDETELDDIEAEGVEPDQDALPPVDLEGVQPGAKAVRPEPKPTPAWAGQYPIRMFRFVRTARTVPKGHGQATLRVEWYEADKMLVDGNYEDLPDGEKNARTATTLIGRYGLTDRHQLAVAVPYLSTDFVSGDTTVKEDGIGDVLAFIKWRPADETRVLPAIAVDAGYYFGTGDADKELGTGEDSWRVTAELSKAWRHVNLHVVPGYRYFISDEFSVFTLDAGAMHAITKDVIVGLEYNYLEHELNGDSHDFVPGVIWKPAEGVSLKGGVILNADSSMPYKSDVSGVVELNYGF